MKTRKIVHLTTAVKPSSSFVSRLVVWVKKEIAPEAILDIQVDPSIVAGAIIIFEGHYQDMSVKKDLEKFFEKRKKAINEIL